MTNTPSDYIEQLIADVANETDIYTRPYEPGDYGLTERNWSVREVVFAMERLNKIKDSSDLAILKQILEHGNGDPETFEGTLLKGVQHNQKIIDEQVNKKKDRR